jgi:hypothetical protein
MADEFDLEAALRNVHSGRRPEPVDRVAVLLPEDMRAERTEPKGKTERRIPEQLPLRPRMPDWSGIGTGGQTAAPIDVVPAERPPVSRRKFGCSICGKKTVMCRDDGSPYEHKCKHGRWCKTERGHIKCKDCEVALVKRMKEKRQLGHVVRRELAENIRVAEQNLPQVAWELVEVVSARSCPLCQEFLQGKRAVRLYTWSAEERAWNIGGVQCLTHPRPGVSMAEMSAAYFEETS